MNDGPQQEAVLALMTMTCLTFPTTIGTLPRHHSDTSQTTDEGAANGSDS